MIKSNSCPITLSDSVATKAYCKQIMRNQHAHWSFAGFNRQVYDFMIILARFQFAVFALEPFPLSLSVYPLYLPLSITIRRVFPASCLCLVSHATIQSKMLCSNVHLSSCHRSLSGALLQFNSVYLSFCRLIWTRVFGKCLSSAHAAKTKMHCRISLHVSGP